MVFLLMFCAGFLAAFRPATWRGRDPYRPAKPRSHVDLGHEALMLFEMLLVGAATRAPPAGQPRRQLHTGMLDLWL